MTNVVSLTAPPTSWFLQSPCLSFLVFKMFRSLHCEEGGEKRGRIREIKNNRKLKENTDYDKNEEKTA